MEITVRDSPNLGVIETTLNSTTIKMLWNLIDEAKQKEEPHNSELAGNINRLIGSASLPLVRRPTRSSPSGSGDGGQVTDDKVNSHCRSWHCYVEDG